MSSRRIIPCRAMAGGDVRDATMLVVHFGKGWFPRIWACVIDPVVNSTRRDEQF